MHKTSVYLTDEEIVRLAALARQEGTSQAEVIRRAIRLYEPEPEGGRAFALIGVADGPGESVADVPEAELLEGFGGVTLVVDAGPLVAVADRRDRWQEAVEAVLREEPGELVVPAPVTAEVDYLLGRRLGRRAQLAFSEDLVAGRFVVARFEQHDLHLVAELERRYDDLDVGLADLSVVVAAQRHRTTRVLTFDEGHFRALRSLDGAPFTLLPRDEPRG